MLHHILFLAHALRFGLIKCVYEYSSVLKEINLSDDVQINFRNSFFLKHCHELILFKSFF